MKFNLDLQLLTIEQTIQISEIAYDFCKGYEWDRIKQTKNVEKIWDFLEGNGANVKVITVIKK